MKLEDFRKWAVSITLLAFGAILFRHSYSLHMNANAINELIGTVNNTVGAHVDHIKTEEIHGYSPSMVETSDVKPWQWELMELEGKTGGEDDGILWVRNEDGTASEMHYLDWHETIKKK